MHAAYKGALAHRRYTTLGKELSQGLFDCWYSCCIDFRVSVHGTVTVSPYITNFQSK
ncbi:MAG: hypothetical protein JO154_10320 [Chitinophaga sp.]|uniref:hypothetical protein n=1 Tax=Chitinophaga sp. TaxID=1869181 RepID=UPI0025C21ACC|nr:hypothetical protein [Chitinophaga sp.]MBV8252989.1 hypothetical protein [Chitinophaga sp.]